mmetsp:Transcript_642/g.1115  ORF Transcript_642/g.1115 Transcript_642/m.1115 type:complete len:117 (-) Transcript_642:222-572(-)
MMAGPPCQHVYQEDDPRPPDLENVFMQLLIRLLLVASQTTLGAMHPGWPTVTKFPKLCLYVTPGALIAEKDVKVIRKTFKNTEMVYLGEGLHYIQEDYPHEIGEAVSKWYKKSVSS